MYSGKQLKDDRECLKSWQVWIKPSRTRGGRKNNNFCLEESVEQIHGDSHTCLGVYSLTHMHTTPPFILGVILCRSVSRDIPLWFSEFWLIAKPFLFFPKENAPSCLQLQRKPLFSGKDALPWVQLHRFTMNLPVLHKVTVTYYKATQTCLSKRSDLKPNRSSHLLGK